MPFEYEDLYPADAVRKAYACMGLAHPVRWVVVDILREHRNRMAVADLMEILRRDYDYRQNYARLAHHLRKMEDGGIIKIHHPKSRKKLIEVELICDVDLKLKLLKGEECVDAEAENK